MFSFLTFLIGIILNLFKSKYYYKSTSITIIPYVRIRGSITMYLLDINHSPLEMYKNSQFLVVYVTIILGRQHDG
jgi:hypothetical protein